MTSGTGTGTRSAFIALCVVLMGSTIYVVGESVRGDGGLARTSRESPSAAVPAEIAREAGVFRLSRIASSIAAEPDAPAEGRTLAMVYQRRAYAGAPPVIPHDVRADMDGQAPGCLACHERGGFVAELKAFAPVTPHPELVSCRQCHVPIAERSLFAETLWLSVSPPVRKRAALPGSPPQIPHGLEMRENCLACHGGTAAAKEIRVSHPERVNCRQCHAAQAEDTLWESALGATRGGS